MIIDDILPEFHFQETHSVSIPAPAERILAEALAYDPRQDGFIRGAITLRELPARLFGRLRGKPVAQKPFDLTHFTPLAQGPDEAVFGMVGRFWQARYGQDPLPDLAALHAYDRAGSVKLVMHFHVEGDNRPRLTTRTRIYCLDGAAKVRLTPYWYLIRPVSGLIRKRMLAAIKRSCLRT
ncbi:hypothetical protein [Thioclava sp. GXIMD4216]|uniref:hypothetical protein n=1 Tax=Thioclava sp. GXIMD4216 TaxID=3131929 RepID=UPI0030CCB2A5